MDEKDIIHDLSNILREIEILEKRIHFFEGIYTDDELIEVILKSTNNQKQDIILNLNYKIVRDYLKENLKSKVNEYNKLKTNIIFK